MTVINGRKRKLPFLQRSWARGIGFWQEMGNAETTLNSTSLPGDKTEDSPEDDETRPQKRPRLEHATESLPKDPSLVDQLFLAHEVGEVQRTLRIEILKIVHRDSTRLKVGDIFSGTGSTAARDVSETTARCKIMLTHTNQGSENMLHCQSQLCTIKTIKGSLRPLRMSRIYLPRPFHIPEDSILINRDDENVFDLADAYTISVELEATGDGAWPPMDVISLDDSEVFSSRNAPPRRWVLTASLGDIFKRTRSLVGLHIKKSPKKIISTDFLMDIDARWTTGYEAGAIRPLEKGVLPSITVSGPLAAVRLQTNGHADGPLANGHFEALPNGLTNGLINGDILDQDEDEEAEEETTPNRSLRTRESKVYNLKLLSDKAQGKDKKRRKRGGFPVIEDGHVSYYLPAEQVALDAYRCVTCGNAHQSLIQLQAHLLCHHSEYDFALRNTNRGPQFHVSHRYDSYSFAAEGFQLGRPIKSFDLESFVNGDISWVDSRYGPENKISNKHYNSASFKSPPGKVIQKPKKNREKLLVPDIKQPLYDPVSKAQLEPGTEFHKHKANDAWLIQWHRDAIADFTDIPPEEREFIQEWDAFMLTKRISSDVYLPPAWANFVREKASWLVASQTRMIEFGKHLSYLLARNALDDKTVETAFRSIAEAREKMSKEQQNGHDSAPKQSPKGTQVRKSAGGCQACGRPVMGPRLLICANPNCGKRLYHSDCIGENAKMSVEDPDWICNDCFKIPVAQRT